MKKDHPRRCGENLSTGKILKSIPGSPPQVRGKLVLLLLVSALFGITPAGAGKTPHSRLKMNYHWDHPRRCGENLQYYLTFYDNLGSPPQVRGKRMHLYQYH